MNNTLLILARVATGAGTIACAAWAYQAQGPDAIGAFLLALGSFIALFFVNGESKPEPVPQPKSVTQQSGENSTTNQAGRDMPITNNITGSSVRLGGGLVTIEASGSGSSVSDIRIGSITHNFTGVTLPIYSLSDFENDALVDTIKRAARKYGLNETALYLFPLVNTNAISHAPAIARILQSKGFTIVDIGTTQPRPHEPILEGVLADPHRNILGLTIGILL
jgi:hypothetical protein